MWKFAAVGKKAVLVAGGAAVAAYSTYEWRQAKEKLAGGGALTEETLDRIFADIDKDKSGSIDANELKTALEKAGMSTGALGMMINAADINKDGKLSKEEFRAVMLGEKAK